jgi:hypothetical protein
MPIWVAPSESQGCKETSNVAKSHYTSHTHMVGGGCTRQIGYHRGHLEVNRAKTKILIFLSYYEY